MKGRCVFWTQAAAEVDLFQVSRHLHVQKRRNPPFSSQVICTSEQEFVFSNQQLEPQKTRSNIFGTQIHLLYIQQKLQEVFKCLALFSTIFSHELFLLMKLVMDTHDSAQGHLTLPYEQLLLLPASHPVPSDLQSVLYSPLLCLNC